MFAGCFKSGGKMKMLTNSNGITRELKLENYSVQPVLARQNLDFAQHLPKLFLIYSLFVTPCLEYTWWMKILSAQHFKNSKVCLEKWENMGKKELEIEKCCLLECTSGDEFLILFNIYFLTIFM